jgi:hypothetical protein
VSDWASLLDAMEEGLDSFPPVLVGSLPDDPGPVPPALVDRGVRTLRRMAEVEAALKHHRAEIGRELAAVSAAHAAATTNAAPSVPHFLDTKA